MSKIKMLETTPGAIDGIHIRKFDKGFVYEIPSQISVSLSKLFLDMGVAKIARERKPLEPQETKPVESSEIKEEIKLDKPIEIEETEKIEDEQIEEDRVVVMRVFQLADELGISSKDIIELANELEISATAPQSGLTQDEVDKIKKDLNV